MSKHVIEGLSEHDRIVAQSFANELFHSAPQTAKFFDLKTDLSEIKSREEQKREARDAGKSLKPSETAKYFERSTVSTIQDNLKPTIINFMEFAKSRGATNLQSALSAKTILKFFQFQEERVEKREITPDTFKTYVGRIKMMAEMSTATTGLPNLDIDKMCDRAIEKANDYVKKMENTENPVVLQKHAIRAYTGNELERIIEKIDDDKIKAVVSIIKEHGFRIRNIANVYLNTQWKKVNPNDPRTWVRERVDADTIAVRGKGNQKHTVTLSKELMQKLKKYADKNNEIHIKQNDIRNAVKRACEANNIKYISVHNLRATYAYNLYKDLKANLYDEQTTRAEVSKKLFHGRTSITMHYVNSAYK